jgi:hypothetical protein
VLKIKLQNYFPEEKHEAKQIYSICLTVDPSVFNSEIVEDFQSVKNRNRRMKPIIASCSI